MEQEVETRGGREEDLEKDKTVEKFQAHQTHSLWTGTVSSIRGNHSGCRVHYAVMLSAAGKEGFIFLLFFPGKIS